VSGSMQSIKEFQIGCLAVSRQTELLGVATLLAVLLSNYVARGKSSLS
jgi:hypothetical protein